VWITATLGLLWCAALAAQQAPRSRPTFKSAVELVSVDVTVVDGRAHPVEDLTATDFALTVDGDSRTIASARFIPRTSSAS
jgi:hypothetical protein